ncbi:MAG: DUF58 domain-containing protein [Spirochaetota bacterium]
MIRYKAIIFIGSALLFSIVPFRSVQWISLTLLLLIVISFLYSRVMFAFFTVRHRRAILRTYRYQDVELSLVLENRSFLSFHAVTVVLPCGTYEKNITKALSLRPGERTEMRYRITCDKRGERIIGPVRAKGADPLGLFPWEKLFSEVATVIVYPAVYDVSLANDRGLPSGNIRIANPLYEDVTRFRSVRDYMPGDDPRSISWKVTARTGKLASLQYLPVLYFPVLIVLDITASHYPLRYRHVLIERAIETAASLARYAVQIQQGVGLITAGTIAGVDEKRYVPLGYGPHHAVAILETLARIELSEKNDDVLMQPLSAGVRMPWGTRLFYVGPAPDENRMNSIFSLRQRAGVDIGLFMLTPLRSVSHLSRFFTVHEVKEQGNELI